MGEFWDSAGAGSYLWNNEIVGVDVATDGANTEFIGFTTGLFTNDGLNGGEGNDIIKGMAGNDVITGGIGMDVIDAGDGSDTCMDVSKSDGDLVIKCES